MILFRQRKGGCQLAMNSRHAYECLFHRRDAMPKSAMFDRGWTGKRRMAMASSSPATKTNPSMPPGRDPAYQNNMFSGLAYFTPQAKMQGDIPIGLEGQKLKRKAHPPLFPERTARTPSSQPLFWLGLGFQAVSALLADTVGPSRSQLPV